MTDIEKIQEIIDEIDELLEVNITPADREFKEWHSRARRFLYHKYGEDSYEYQEFIRFKFIPSAHVDKLIAELMIYDACRSDLKTIKGLFSDYLRELQDEKTEAPEKPVEPECLERIFTRFRQVANQLTRRHNGRETLCIQDEYDVQDLLRALLSLYFDDVRPEEWTPSYAGSSLRIDFLIPEIEAVIEVKKTRKGMTDKTLSEELIVDIEKYQAHPNCKKIYCFVYDPDMILRNPAAIRNDLEQKHQGLVRVFIES